MDELVNAIKSKYGASDEVSRQVVGVLTEVEKHRQAHASGMRAAGQTPDLMSIVGGLLGSQGSGNLLGEVGSLLGGGNASQPSGGQANVMNIVNDLLGGANHPSQAPDLMSIVGGLLGGQGTQGGSDIMGLVSSLLGGQGGGLGDVLGGLLGGNQPAPQAGATLNHPTQQQSGTLIHPTQQEVKPNMGSIGDALEGKLGQKTPTIQKKGEGKTAESSFGERGGQQSEGKKGE